MDKYEIITTCILVICVLVIYYCATSNNRKHAKELKEMQDGLKKGDKIVTYSGLSGIIEEVVEDRVIVSLNPSKIKISIEKWAVAGLDDRTID